MKNTFKKYENIDELIEFVKKNRDFLTKDCKLGQEKLSTKIDGFEFACTYSSNISDATIYGGFKLTNPTKYLDPKKNEILKLDGYAIHFGLYTSKNRHDLVMRCRFLSYSDEKIFTRHNDLPKTDLLLYCGCERNRVKDGTDCTFTRTYYDSFDLDAVSRSLKNKHLILNNKKIDALRKIHTDIDWTLGVVFEKLNEIMEHFIEYSIPK